MKSLKVYILCILIVIGFNSTAQYDSIFTLVSGDTVTLWQTGAYRNCGALYRMEINQDNHQINWYQIDTGMAAFCYCTYNLSVTYGPLEPGDFSVNVFYTESFIEDTIFDGSTTFTIENRRREVNSGVIGQYQSECYMGIVDLEKDNTDFRIYPVPVRDGGLLHLEILPGGGNSVLKIYSLTGKLVYSKQYDGNQPIQDQFLKDDLFPVSGLYLVVLRTGQQVITRKVPVF